MKTEKECQSVYSPESIFENAAQSFHTSYSFIEFETKGEEKEAKGERIPNFL